MEVVVVVVRLLLLPLPPPPPSLWEAAWHPASGSQKGGMNQDYHTYLDRERQPGSDVVEDAGLG